MTPDMDAQMIKGLRQLGRPIVHRPGDVPCVVISHDRELVYDPQGDVFDLWVPVVDEEHHLHPQSHAWLLPMDRKLHRSDLPLAEALALVNG